MIRKITRAGPLHGFRPFLIIFKKRRKIMPCQVSFSSTRLAYLARHSAVLPEQDEPRRFSGELPMENLPKGAGVRKVLLKLVFKKIGARSLFRFTTDALRLLSRGFGFLRFPSYESRVTRYGFSNRSSAALRLQACQPGGSLLISCGSRHNPGALRLWSLLKRPFPRVDVFWHFPEQP